MNTVYFTDEDLAAQAKPEARIAPAGIPAYWLAGKHGMTHGEVLAANTAAQSAFHNGMSVRVVSTNIRGRVIGASAGMVEVSTRDGILCWPMQWLIADAE